MKIANSTSMERANGTIKKASGKVSSLSKIFPFVDLTKRRVLMNSFSS